MDACIFHPALSQCFRREFGEEKTEGSGQMKSCAGCSTWTKARIRYIE